MSASFELNAEVRSEMGTNASRRLRGKKKFPAVLYGAGKDPVNLTLDHDVMMHNLEREAFYSHILTLKYGGKDEKVVLKDIQRHPSAPKITHMDFMRVSETTKLRLNIPLHFMGEDSAPGVKQSGGIVAHLMSNIEIICHAKHLPEYIEVDISELHTGHSLHLSDIKLPEGVQIVSLLQGEGHDLPIVSINIPRGAATTSTDEEDSAEKEGSE